MTVPNNRQTFKNERADIIGTLLLSETTTKERTAKICCVLKDIVKIKIDDAEAPSLLFRKKVEC